MTHAPCEEDQMNEAIRQDQAPTLLDELSHLLNRHSAESESDTPDYLLAGFLMQCLRAWNSTTQQREIWYGRNRPNTPAEIVSK